jgi:presequence protease
MTTLHGFDLVRDEHITELKSRARMYRHIKTGAQLLSLTNDDENKVFGVNFPTPPADSTGLPHIMEHSVLCGSRNYPTKEPFIELAKSSLNTFLNAMTFADKTVYPVASQNTQDLYNLVDVYLDAVFHPNISEWTLKQEGWHYELAAPEEEMIFKGVVFNEMKGAYSSPEARLAQATRHSLFPDTPSGVDSGGDPKVIPDLTYAQFKAFHETFYHPSNALIWWSGNDDETERLRRLDGVLSEFDAKLVQINFSLQKPYQTPKTVRAFYDADDTEGVAKNYVTVTWVNNDVLDAERTLTLDVLSDILLGSQAAPLRKAMIESGLGEGMTSSGYDSGERQTTFTAGLKGVPADSVDKVEPLILDTLRKLSTEGIEPEMIESALNTIEFRMREMNTGGTPRGLVMMIWALQTWLHGGDPFESLRYEAPLVALKARLATGEKVFEKAIADELLANPFRLTVTLAPDKSLNEREAEAEKARLDAARAKMTTEDIARIISETHTLREMQVTPDSPEALARIPSLAIEDLDRTNKTVSSRMLLDGPARIMQHDVFTNGIAYLDWGFDLRALPPEDVPMAGLFARALLSMGTDKEDYAKLSQRIGRKTGGLRASSVSGITRGTGNAASWMVLRGKATYDQVDDLLAIAHDVLLTARMDNRERFKQLVLEEKAGLEAGFAPSGHRFAAARLRARYNASDWAAEISGGVSYVFWIRELVNRIESDWPGVLAQLERVRKALINRGAMIANATMDNASWAKISPRFTSMLNALPARPGVRSEWPVGSFAPREGLSAPAQVNYVAKGTDLFKHGYAFHGSALVVLNYLNTVWLWERIRVQGGAYGGFCGLDQRSGVFTFGSYRDPNLSKSLEVYDATAQFLRDHTPGEAEVRKCIIGVIGDMDAHELPDAKGFSAFSRHLLGTSDETRQRIREEVLSTTPAHFLGFADVVDTVRVHGDVVVVGAAGTLEASGEGLAVTRVL